jgi:thiol-disulfide isomerase/thioredoxin
MILDRRTVVAALVATILPRGASADALPLVQLPGEVEAPDFSLLDLAGTPHRGADYRGQPLLVAFWAVWCPPCRRELAALAELQMRLAETPVKVLSINLGDSAERIASFLADHPAPGLPVLLDPDKAMAAPWHVRGLPTAYAVDGKGILRLGAIGERDWRAPVIETQLRALA